MSSLISHIDDISLVRALLDRGERIVTVTGSAGVGKSRVVREVIDRLAMSKDESTTSFLRCDLAEARTADDVAVALACTLRAPASFGSSPIARIAARLAEHGSTILVLDDADHLVSTNVDWLTWLLDGAPELQIIITSREPLGGGMSAAHNERVHRLAPLSNEDGRALLMQLLAPTTTFDDLERDSLARLSAELGGMPFALELAAPIIAEHGATAVLSNLLRWERTHSKAGEALTTREIIEWAWRHLDAQERQVLSRAAAFRGGFTIDAALAVGIGSSVQALAEKAWLRERAGSTPIRFDLHRDIRALAESVDDGEPSARLTAHYLELADTLCREVSSSTGKEAIDRLAIERENLTAIATRALEMRDGSSAGRALIALLHIALAYGPVTPFLSLVRQVLDLPLTIDRRISLLAARGRALRRLGLLNEAEEAQHEAAELAHGAGFRREEARLLGELGLTAYSRSMFAVALTRFRAALALQINLGDFTEQAVTLTQLAMVHRERGAIDDARHAAMRALPIHRSANNARYEAATLVELAICDLATGDFERARAMIASVLPVLSGTLAAFARIIAGVVEHSVGDLDAAERHYDECLSASRDLGHARLEATVLAWRGILSFDRGNFEQSRERLDQAVDLLMSIGDVRYGALATGYLFASVLLLGNEPRANELLRTARELVDPQDPARTTVDILEATLWGTPLPELTESQARSSWDVRIAQERYLRTHPLTTHAEETPSTPPSSRSSCHVAVDGAWIGLRDGRQVACDRRVATQRLLAALARARAESPGRAIAADALVAVGWPNERILSSAARNRLRVALSWLRKNGLGRALASGSEGYFLDPSMVDVAEN